MAENSGSKAATATSRISVYNGVRTIAIKVDERVLVTTPLNCLKHSGYYYRAIRDRMSKTTVHHVVGIDGPTLIVFVAKAHYQQLGLISPGGAAKGERKIYYSAEARLEQAIREPIEIPIEVELRYELWGDRYFVATGQNKTGVDIVQYRLLQEPA